LRSSTGSVQAIDAIGGALLMHVRGHVNSSPAFD